MNSCDWLQGLERKVARAYLISGLEQRWDVMKGEAHTYLTNFCTRPEARNRGAARALVTWDLQQAASLDIPACCEPSEISLELYKKLGFRGFATMHAILEGELFSTCPVLVKAPEKTATQ
jgi:ribosomal protein S18 acetylase RimI-like enzyme